jgi:ribosome-associated translation inhibitor RaiA
VLKEIYFGNVTHSEHTKVKIQKEITKISSHLNTSKHSLFEVWLRKNKKVNSSIYECSIKLNYFGDVYFVMKRNINLYKSISLARRTMAKIIKKKHNRNTFKHTTNNQLAG